MTESATGPLYDLWAYFYDKTFGALVKRRQQSAVDQFRLTPGDRVLDLGVGTGMTLPHYPDDVTIIGLDLSAGMLVKAAKKKQEIGLRHCHLVRADAMLPPFEPHSFDHILISHAVSVVSDPGKLMYWARNLLKPGGRIVVLNHFRSTHPFIAWWEKKLNPIFMKIGWRSDLALDDCLRGSELYIEYVFHLRSADLWKIVVLTDQRPATAPSEGLTDNAKAHPAPAT